jgi:putative ABC transport system ATP-binding protein
VLVRLAEVKKRYGAQLVLDGASLEVAAGELVAVIGRSGSGKSTLLHLIGGLDRRYEGRVEVCGRDLATLDDAALSRMRNREVGFVFQSFNLLDHLSVTENVALPAWLGPAVPDRAEVARRVGEVLAEVGMAGFAERRPGELSGGQKQRVAIARALYGRPQLLLCDEPTGNLDAETGEEIIRLFARLGEGGLTLVVVTHEERVSRVAGRVLRVEHGRLEAA